jgi:hypothetical protein
MSSYGKLLDKVLAVIVLWITAVAYISSTAQIL